MKKKILGILSVLVAVLVMSHNAGALNLEYSVASYWAGAQPYSTLWGSNDGNNGNSYICAGGTDYRTAISRLLIFFDNNMASSVRAGDIFELNLSGTSDGNNNVNLDFAINLYDAYGNFDVIDVNYSSAGLSSAKFQIILMAKKNNVTAVDLRRVGNIPFVTMSKTGGGLECLATGNWTAYHSVGNGSQAIVDAINNSSDAGAINSAKDAIVGAINEQNQKEEEATENIANQTPQDMSSSGNTENQASSNLIDLIRSFVTALTSINTGNCDITLDFPAYAGGSRTVNICQNKDKAGNLISVFSSLTLIVFYIPLALKLLTMIYNEIRSFTNG